VFRDTPFVIIQTNKKNVYLGFGYPKWFFLSFKEFFKIFSLRNQIPWAFEFFVFFIYMVTDQYLQSIIRSSVNR
jgi:hypothetical protein